MLSSFKVRQQDDQPNKTAVATVSYFSKCLKLFMFLVKYFCLRFNRVTNIQKTSNISKRKQEDELTITMEIAQTDSN